MRSAEIGILLVWVGPWQPWIELTLHSFARNSRFDLHIISPEMPPGLSAPNIYFHRLNRAALSQRLGQFLNTDYILQRAYKLCDFRPAYAHLFPEIIGKYRFWGWCDEDIIWGDLGRFVTPAVLECNDIITTCRCSITGQLTLVRSTRENNMLYTHIPEWQSKFLDQSSSHTLDERPFNEVALELEAAGRLRVFRRQLQTHDVNSTEWNLWADELEMAETGQPHGEFKHGPAYWTDGRLYHSASRDEFAFFHFGNWKRIWALPRIALPPVGITEWHFSADGIRFNTAGPSSESVRRYLSDYKSDCRAARIQAKGRRVRETVNRFSKRIGRSILRRLKADRLGAG